MAAVFRRVYNHLEAGFDLEDGGESVTALAGYPALVVGRSSGTDGRTDGHAIRAAVCHDTHSVEHDDVNLMCIGAQIIRAWLATDLVTSYLQADFSTDEDCRRRVRKLAEMDGGH